MKQLIQSERIVYPFTAIVGQEEMVLALILNAINPRIGGVLIQGERGRAIVDAGYNFRFGVCFLCGKTN